ncbi:MAG: MauE/DoxX family redox-associated membrane protein [Actinomycetota bacterium]
MSTVAAPVATAASFGVLTWSGASHLLHLRLFREALASHSVWDGRRVTFVAWAVTATELVVGARGLLAVWDGDAAWTRVAALAAVLVFAAFAVYAGLVIRHDSDAPCGCSTHSFPMTGWTVVRAGAFAFAAALAAGSGHTMARHATEEQVLLTIVALTLGTIVWTFPGAMHQVRGATPARAGRGGADGL